MGSRGLGPKSTQNPQKTNARDIALPRKMARDRSTVKRCLAALAPLEMLEEEEDRVTKRGKTMDKAKGKKGIQSTLSKADTLGTRFTVRFRESSRKLIPEH